MRLRAQQRIKIDTGVLHKASRSVITVAAVTLSVLAATFGSGQSQAAGYAIGGKILEEYNQSGVANGYPNGIGFLGDAITREADAGRGGRFQKFAKNSSIYWHPLVTNGHANQLGGAIRDRWLEPAGGNQSAFAEYSPLKYPTSREKATRPPGRFNTFEGGAIYHSSSTGAHRIWGQIRQTWANADWEAGPYGFPKSEEFNCADDNPNDDTGAFGGFGQFFQGNGPTYDNDWIVFNTGDFTTPGNSSVTADKKINLFGTTQYTNARASALQSWNALGLITVQNRSGSASTDDDVQVSDSDSPLDDYLGVYIYIPGQPNALRMNKYILGADDGQFEQAIMTHEVGHALGLGHNCAGQLMSPYTYSPDEGFAQALTPQAMDIDAYNDNWG